MGDITIFKAQDAVNLVKLTQYALMSPQRRRGFCLLLRGNSGSGRTMIARRIARVPADESHHEAVEAAWMHTTLGHFEPQKWRPFRAPHYTVSRAAMTGSGYHSRQWNAEVFRPGEVALAHTGTLFLDEVVEFSLEVIQGVARTVQSGEVVLHRKGETMKYPANFLLVMSVRWCPCGKDPCACSPSAQSLYKERWYRIADEFDSFVVNLAWSPHEALKFAEEMPM